jgi:hypothetical protein
VLTDRKTTERVFWCVVVLVAASSCGPRSHEAHQSDNGDASSRHDGGVPPLDGGSRGDGGLASDAADAPHRPVAVSCDHVRPSEVPDGGFGFNIPDGGAATGYCNTDVDCEEADAGTDGRCTMLPSVPVPLCSYDACFSDSDCGDAGVCACRDPNKGAANTCVPSNCRVDADCGPGVLCSPTLGGCNSFTGVDGYYCHTPNDQCSAPADCFTGSCVYDLATARWVCGTLDCAG